jgi:hypothetical protein
MSADFMNQIASDTAGLSNKRAWVEILRRIDEAGVSKRHANALRDSVWLVRKRLADERRASKGGAQT